MLLSLVTVVVQALVAYVMSRHVASLTGLRIYVTDKSQQCARGFIS